LRILAYVKSSLEKVLMYKKHEHIGIFGYSGSSYAGDKGDRKSTTRYSIFIGENLVTWRSKKQDISRFSIEAGYRGMTHTTCQMMKLMNLLLELQFKQFEPMSIFCDNQFAIYIAQNSVFHERTEDIVVDCYLVKVVWTKKVIFFIVYSIFKAASGSSHQSRFTKCIFILCSKLDMIDIYAAP